MDVGMAAIKNFIVRNKTIIGLKSYNNNILYTTS